MKLNILSQKNCLCEPELFTKYQALYEGGKTFHKNIALFLNKNLFEGNDTYQLRQKEASYESYINTLVNQFSSQLFSSPFVVRSEPESIDEFYTEFKEDCDLNGSDLVTFTHKLFTCALVKGAAWLIAEMPDDGAPPPESLLEYQDRGLGRAWLNSIDASDVLDWQVDSFGQLLWCITHKIEKNRLDPRSERNMVTETWKIYDQSNVETFQVTYKENEPPAKDSIIPSLGVKAHGFNRVPLLCLRLPVGLWLVNRLADAQIEHFRMNNGLGWSMRRSCYPTAVFKTDDKDSGALIKSSDGFGVMIGKDEELSWITPATDSFTEMANRVRTFKDEIHRLALQMALAVDNTPGTMKRSGESKAKDSEATQVILFSYADLVKGFIEEIYELVSDARGDTGVTFSIEGMDHFNVDDSEQVINVALIAQGLNIPSDIFKKELAIKVAETLLPHVSQDIKDDIRAEIMAAKIEALPVAPPNGAKPPGALPGGAPGAPGGSGVPPGAAGAAGPKDAA
jgi:hypothetical protein